jgi:hypothetical protein
LIIAEYTKVFTCPHSQNSRGLREWDHAGQLTGSSVTYPLFIKNLVQVLSNNEEKMRWCPIMHDPHVVVDEEAHVPSILVNH